MRFRSASLRDVDKSNEDQIRVAQSLGRRKRHRLGLASERLYLALVEEREWAEDYEAWLTSQLAAALLAVRSKRPSQHVNDKQPNKRNFAERVSQARAAQASRRVHELES